MGHIFHGNFTELINFTLKKSVTSHTDTPSIDRSPWENCHVYSVWQTSSDLEILELFASALWGMK